MSVFGRIVKVSQKSTTLWHNGHYHILPFASKHRVGDIIDQNDRLLTQSKSKNEPKAIEQKYRIAKERFSYIKRIKEFMLDKGFEEVITPKLKEKIIHEPNINLIKTSYGYLAPSPELEIKKLLALGFEKVFELNWAYRNDPINRLHKKEFLMLEWYESMKTPQETIQLLIELIRFLNNGSDELKVKENTIDLTQIMYVEYGELFKKYCGIDIYKLDVEKLKKAYSIEGNISAEELLDAIFAIEIESTLGNRYPTVVHNFPASKASLARIENGYARRFELYINGIELANCYKEETSWDKLKNRINVNDESFIEAMKMGLPPMSGIAVGVDRLIMLLMNLYGLHEAF